ncbi:MAG: hypothetical protein KGN76_10545 [Acidobacteriota bacterium]|nr:hypothetical protein [Acidobacteriota bacterium]
MIHYTDHISQLIRDIVLRVPALSFIQPADVLVFARLGRTGADGPYATCHSLNLPPSEPGYYFWRDRESGRLTRRSEWFVTKSPSVSIAGHEIKYLLSFTLPRFCDQSLLRSYKREFYHDSEPWVAKLDTIVHELYHIDPEEPGIRRVTRADGEYSARMHSPGFFQEVVQMVHQYLASGPDPAVYEFLRDDFRQLEARYGGVVGTTFRTFPSYPQRYVEPLSPQPAVPGEAEEVALERLRVRPARTRYTEADLRLRRFTAQAARPLRGRFTPVRHEHQAA